MAAEGDSDTILRPLADFGALMTKRIVISALIPQRVMVSGIEAPLEMATARISSYLLHFGERMPSSDC